MSYDGNAYDQHTVNSRNPLARFSHRNRLRRSTALARTLLRGGALLDYGCGSGGLVIVLTELGERAIGYEPYMARQPKSSSRRIDKWGRPRREGCNIHHCDMIPNDANYSVGNTTQPFTRW